MNRVKQTILSFFIFSLPVGFLYARRNPISRLIGSFRKKTRHCYNNFHCVEKGKLYRSAQMSHKTLRWYIKKYGIKTVINLRGIHPGKRWWRLERFTVLNGGAHYFNISMHAGQLTKKEDLKKLLSIYQSAKGPILIHCQGGADRTGEASALWRIEMQRKSKKRALKQLSMHYNHIKSWYPAKRFLIKEWRGQKWLENSYNRTNYTYGRVHV